MRHWSLLAACALTLSLAPVTATAQEAPLAGRIDLHVHAAPDSRAPRSVNVFEAARLARSRGMRALLLKNHYTETASQAYLVADEVPGIEVFGGITLNRTVGGINVAAVESMAAITGGLGRVVWLPTFDSEHNAPDAEHVSIARNGALLPETLRLLDAMGRLDLALATGHSSPEEVLLVIRAARSAGIDRIVVTHPSSELVGMTVDQQLEAARLGALLEYTIMTIIRDAPVEEFAAQIRAVGPENVVLTTDLGQAGNPVHVDGLRDALSRLAEAGFSDAELDLMTKGNPARLLGLD